MKEKNSNHNSNSVAVLILLLLALFLLPIKKIEWGKLRWLESETITVTGEAELREKNQIARFTVGVNLKGEDKEELMEEVNSKMEKVIKQVKDFGIKDEDIKTQNVNIYEVEKEEVLPVRDDAITSTNSNEGYWRANNSITLTLKEVDKASELTSLLSSGEANMVNGPSLLMMIVMI